MITVSSTIHPYDTLPQNQKIHAVFVADLHLSVDTPLLIQAFLALIDDLTVKKVKNLFILGDWLDAWIGDDDYLSLNTQEKSVHWLTQILTALTHLSQHTHIYVMHGNRDFALRQGLCDVFGGVLVNEPYVWQGIRLEHGDRLCTDDKAYQRYRRIIRNPLIGWLLLKQPLSKRRQLAQNIKAKSHTQKEQKTATIMDANTKAVAKALRHTTILLHGHTHRPNVHQHQEKYRLVLGDWQAHPHQATAVIGVCFGADQTNMVNLGLYEFIYPYKFMHKD